MNRPVPVGDLLGGTGIPVPASSDNASARSAAAESKCRACGLSFNPRGPGRKQVFCSTACRRAYHDRGQGVEGAAVKRGQTSTFEDDNSDPHGVKSQICKFADLEFDWLTADEVCIPEQQGIAVYELKSGGVVIRQQRAWCDDEDSMIEVKPENLQKLIDRLCDLAGILSVGKTRP